MTVGVGGPCFWCGLPAVKRGTAPALIADLLESDPEVAWTINEIALRVHLRRNTAHVALRRLRDAGVVEREGTNGNEGLWRWVGRTEGWRIVAVRQ